MFEWCDGHQNEWTRDLSQRIKNCASSQKYLKRMVKSGCAQGYPDQLHNNSKEKVRIAVLQAIKAHRTFKEFFRPYIVPTAIPEIFYEDKIDSLRQRNSKLKFDSATFERQFLELSKSDEKRQQNFIQLQRQCQELQQELQVYQQGGVETDFKRRELQFEETLRAQNNLIDDLKRRLSDSVRETEILRSLNKGLETEVKKRSSAPELDIVPTGNPENIIINTRTSLQLLAEPTLPKALERPISVEDREYGDTTSANMQLRKKAIFSKAADQSEPVQIQQQHGDEASANVQLPSESILPTTPEQAQPVQVQQQHVDVTLQNYIQNIRKIRADVERLANRLEQFFGQKEDREYVYIKECLIRDILKLDKIQTNGNQFIEEQRKEVIYEVQQLLIHLESKCAG